MFAFCTPNDFNLYYIKISKFTLLIGTNLAMSVLFFFDESMHTIYINHGGFNLIQQIPQIIYSSLISSLLEYGISFLILSEREIYRIKNKKNKSKEEYMRETIKILKCIQIKFVFLRPNRMIFL